MLAHLSIGLHVGLFNGLVRFNTNSVNSTHVEHVDAHNRPLIYCMRSIFLESDNPIVVCLIFLMSEVHTRCRNYCTQRSQLAMTMIFTMQFITPTRPVAHLVRPTYSRKAMGRPNHM